MQIAGRASRFSFESASEVISEAHRLQAEGRDIVHLHLGEPDFSTPGHIVDVAERAMRSGVTHYTPPGGMREARAAIAADASRRCGVEIAPEQVVLTSGSTQALLFSMLALVEPGSEVVVQDPCYSPYLGLVQLAGGTAVAVRSEAGDGRIEMDRLRGCIGPATRVLLINSPHNPTGGVLSEEELEGVAYLAERHDLWVISDEVYHDLVYDRGRAPSLLSVANMAERTICIDSFSKTFAMCGWRVGFAIAPLPVARRLELIMVAGGLCAPSVAQVACIEALTSPASERAVSDMRDEFRRRRDVMVDGLRRIRGFRCQVPAGAFYAFPDISETGVEDVELAWRLLREAGVALIPGSVFGDGGVGHLRLSYATSVDVIREGLRRMSETLARWADWGS